jgi:hypothetical protein
MPQSDQSVEPLDDAEIYSQIQQFYARQMSYLDSGNAEEWAATFTEDGVFSVNVRPEPIHGRAAIAASARRGAQRMADSGAVLRHWVGMMSISRRADGAIVAQSYSLVISTPAGGPPTLTLSTVVEDVLVRQDGTWLTAERLVSHDDARPAVGSAVRPKEPATVSAAPGF